MKSKNHPIQSNESDKKEIIMAYKEINEDVDVLDRINAMLSHEENTARCQNYFTDDQEQKVDAACRKAMVDWCLAVCDSFAELSRETVACSMSILDRYLSSGKGNSAEVLRCKQKFQLAAITAFYTAVKIHEPVQLGMATLLKLCRGFYNQETIVAMENDILSSLEWRISLSSTTPMEYVRHFLELLPLRSDVADVILEGAETHMDCATGDVFFSTCLASSVGVACLAGAIDDTCVLSSLEKDALWCQLSRKLDFDIASNEIRKVELKLLAKSTTCEPKRQSRASLPRSSVNFTSEQASSPVSVVVMA